MNIDFGQDDSQSTESISTFPELDDIPIYIELRYTSDGTWHTIAASRILILQFLGGDPEFEDRNIYEFCLVTFEGEEYDLRTIYNLATKQWRIE